MTEWGGIHTDTHISGTDGFSMVKFRGPEWDWTGENMVEFILRLLPNEDDRPKAWKDVKQLVKTNVENNSARDLPYEALKLYLCKSMSNTFALGKTKSNLMLVGTKSGADQFKLILAFEDAEKTKVWDSNITFYVRVKKGDKFVSDGNAATGHKRQFSNEGW